MKKEKYIKVRIIPDIKIKTPILLKRSCFLCEETLKASLMDGVKVIYNYLDRNNSNNKYGVIYENGFLSRKWR